MFDNKPMTLHKRNKNLCKLIGGHAVQGENVFKTHLQKINGESERFNAMNKTSLCFAQVMGAKTFESY